MLCFFLWIDRISLNLSSFQKFFLGLALSPFVLIPSGDPHELFHRLFISPRGLIGFALFILGIIVLKIQPRLNFSLKKWLILAGSFLILSPLSLYKIQDFRFTKWDQAYATAFNIHGEKSGIFQWMKTSKNLKTAVYGSEIYYSFYGPHWQNQLFFDRSSQAADFEMWIKQLCQHSVNAVGFYKYKSPGSVNGKTQWPSQRNWVFQEAAFFKPLYQDSLAEVWQIQNKACL
jgi:hypothetical protein